MLELRQRFGLNRLTLDDRGVTRRGVLRAAVIGWDEIDNYRLTMAFRTKGELRFGLELIGEAKRVGFDSRFGDVTAAVAQVLQRIREPILAQARCALADHGFAQFGPLRLASDAVGWGTQAPCKLEQVEAIELFDDQPFELRVMTHGQSRPYGHARTAAVPNLFAALQLAEELGYPLRGRSLAAAIA